MKKLPVAILVLAAVFTVIFLGACGNRDGRQTVAVDLSDARLHSDPVLARAGLDRDMRFLTQRTITVGIWDRATEADPTPEDNFWTTFIREGMMRDHNVNVEFVAIPRWSEVQFLNNLMAAGTAPDVISTYDYPTILTYANMGGILDMTPLIRDYRHIIPSVVELLMDEFLFWNQDPATGQNWALLGRRFINPAVNVFIRHDWLQILGLQPPRTTQEFERMLYAFRDNAARLVPPGRSPSEIIPWGVSDNITWGAQTLINSMRPSDLTDRDRYIYGYGAITLPGTKEALRMMNRWYNDDLLWRDFALGGALDMDDLMKIGLVGVHIQNWDHPFRSGGLDINTTLQRLFGPQAYFFASNPPPFTDDRGYPMRDHGTAGDRTIAFPASNTEPVASLLYLEWITKLENRMFLQIGVEGINHIRHPNGAIEMLVAGAPHAINSVNNFDYTITINGINFGDVELTTRSLALAYPGIPPELITQAFNVPEHYDRVGRNVQVGEIAAQAGIGPSLTELQTVVFSQSVSAPVANFDRVFDDGLAAYLAAGGQAIIDERRQAWQRVYGNATMLPPPQ